MTIYEALKKDHKKLLSTLDELSAAESLESRRRLVNEVRDLLVPHSRAEEAVLYNLLRDKSETKEVVAHSYGEHIKAETLLRGLQLSEAVALNWKAGVNKLKEDITHHIEEEEGRVFAAAKKVIWAEEEETLAKAFKEVKSDMGSGVLSSNLELIANLLPARFRKSVLETDKAKKAS